ncbi:hypothetical protein F5J12DRAFT_896119 [Pisolithus orientalis]|uniref:uncharacterized protein n=1 Tax=Pisolithus orientalis TaxID=936130 RepID=UPI0022250140|nr:uncharacterized protein F5J12DRAFT_896119 [Pisolithus orientalis]KAI5996592.1 hypothetical protein F5J12DRAFT_896119 [Pisolithus orientalis]
MDKDADALNNDFIGECMQAINMYSGDAKKRSYGVQDKYRMSGAAVEQAILVVPQRMEELLASNPILWILTKVWLEFMARHIRALQFAQISLKELEPPNLGILTSIICHMIQCTSTTEIILNFHVRESMALLQVSRVCERLGMFFLLDLDLHHVPHLPEVQDHDDLEVLKLMEGKLKRGDRQPAWPRIPPLDKVEQFPIGKRVNLFFPGPTAGQPSWRSPWNVFWTKPGYIWEYHQVMKNRMPLEEFEVLDHLGRIFSVLQTLPDVTKGSEKSPGKTWWVEGEKVVLVTNPKFYKIKGISTKKEQQQARR